MVDYWLEDFLQFVEFFKLRLNVNYRNLECVFTSKHGATIKAGSWMETSIAAGEASFPQTNGIDGKEGKGLGSHGGNLPW